MSERIRWYLLPLWLPLLPVFMVLVVLFSFVCRAYQAFAWFVPNLVADLLLVWITTLEPPE